MTGFKAFQVGPLRLAARVWDSSFKAWEDFRWTPHPVIVTIRDIRDYVRVLLYSCYTAITGWGVLLR